MYLTKTGTHLRAEFRFVHQRAAILIMVCPLLDDGFIARGYYDLEQVLDTVPRIEQNPPVAMLFESVFGCQCLIVSPK